MQELSFSMATGMHERGRPLAEGRVVAEGLKLTSIMLKDNGARHDRFNNGEFDAAEVSFANYLRAWSQRLPFEGIPVFLNRQFRHGSIYVNAAAGIREPRDLEGKRLGVMTWFNTAALWARGALQHEYGVDLAKIRWVTSEASEVDEPTLPTGVKLSAATGPLVKLLLAGELDALITPRTPARDHAQKIVRLFPDVRAVEADYYRRTGAYPMSHVLVVRKPLLDQHPWLAARLFEACTQARGLAAEYADDPEHSTLAWFGAQMEREVEVLGPNAGAYGIEANRKTLEVLVTYGHSSGLLARRPAIEELFHVSARTLAAEKG